MICKKCKKEIPEGSKHCPFCGAVIENDKQELPHDDPETVIQDSSGIQSFLAKVKNLSWQQKLIFLILLIVIIVILTVSTIESHINPVEINASFKKNYVFSNGAVYDNDDPNINVYATYKNGETKKITGWYVDEPVKYKAGKNQTLGINYRGQHCTLNINGKRTADKHGNFLIDAPTYVAIYTQFFNEHSDGTISFHKKGDGFTATYAGIQATIVCTQGVGKNSDSSTEEGKHIDGVVLQLILPKKVCEQLIEEKEAYDYSEHESAIDNLLIFFYQINSRDSLGGTGHESFLQVQDWTLSTLGDAMRSGKQEVSYNQNMKMYVGMQVKTFRDGAEITVCLMPSSKVNK